MATSRAIRTWIEVLEARIAPATFIVTTTADAGAGSLRQAILDSNANGTTELDVIEFDIGEGGTQSILVESALPKLDGNAIIDGSTQAGYENAPLIVLDGTMAAARTS